MSSQDVKIYSQKFGELTVQVLSLEDELRASRAEIESLKEALKKGGNAETAASADLVERLHKAEDEVTMWRSDSQQLHELSSDFQRLISMDADYNMSVHELSKQFHEKCKMLQSRTGDFGVDRPDRTLGTSLALPVRESGLVDFRDIPLYSDLQKMELSIRLSTEDAAPSASARAPAPAAILPARSVIPAASESTITGRAPELGTSTVKQTGAPGRRAYASGIGQPQRPQQGRVAEQSWGGPMPPDSWAHAEDTTGIADPSVFGGPSSFGESHSSRGAFASGEPPSSGRPFNSAGPVSSDKEISDAAKTKMPFVYRSPGKTFAESLAQSLVYSSPSTFVPRPGFRGSHMGTNDLTAPAPMRGINPGRDALEKLRPEFRELVLHGSSRFSASKLGATSQNVDTA